MDNDTIDLFKSQQEIDRILYGWLNTLTTMIESQQRQIVSITNFVNHLASHITGVEDMPGLPSPESLATAAEEIERLKKIWDLDADGK